VSSRRTNLDVDAATLRLVAEEAFGHGATANVARADEQDVHAVVTPSIVRE
jgi:hypothetical protein